MKACGYCGKKNEDTASNCSECGTEFPRPDHDQSHAEPPLPMTNWEIAFGIVCWLTTVLGGFYALVVTLLNAMNPAGKKPTLPFTIFVLPLATTLLATFTLRSASARGKVDGLGWLYVTPLCISAITLILFLLLWFHVIAYP